MDAETPELRRLVQQLASDTLNDTLANVRQHSEVRRLVASGEINDQELAAAYTEYAQRSGPEYRRAVADLTLRYYAALAEVANDYSRRFYEQVVAAVGPAPRRPPFDWTVRHDGVASDPARATAASPPSPSPPPSPPPTPAPQRVPMELHAAPGRVAMGSFSLDNRRDEPVTVSFDASRWRGSDGSEFDNPVVVVPEWVQLPPGGRADITLSVRLRRELYHPDHLYSATVAVRGNDGLMLLLNAWVEPEAAEPAVTTPGPGLAAEVPAAPAEPAPEREARAGLDPAPLPPPPPGRAAAGAKRSAAKRPAAKKSAAARPRSGRKGV